MFIEFFKTPADVKIASTLLSAQLYVLKPLIT